MFYNPAYKWQAGYETDKGHNYTVEGTSIDECPTSYISGFAAEIVGSLDIANRVRASVGESPLPSPTRWPVRLIDASRIIALEEIRQGNAAIDEDRRHEG